MTGQITNHLWQSTLFAIAAGILTLAFRKNRAQVRYWLWLSASLKFLVPFALLMGLGSLVERPSVVNTSVTQTVSDTVVQIAQPFSEAPPKVPARRRTRDWSSIALVSVWACGFAVIALIRLRGWVRVGNAIRSSTSTEISAAVEVRSSPGLLEPGVVGFRRPILLLPAGILDRLTTHQLDAVLAHELCHVRRRDNLTSAIHMIVEGIFWFHPLVWWLGARLVEERERACDEEVVQLGNEPQVYAEGILNVCKNYLESPLSCVSGVTGSDLKKRIQTILTEGIARDLNFAKKAALAVAGAVALAAPIVIGVLNAPIIRAQSAPADTPKFEVASIKLCNSNEPGGRSGGKSSDRGPQGAGGDGPSPARLNMNCQPLMNYIRSAYISFADGHFKPWRAVVPIEGGPGWVNSERYKIEAKAESPQGRSIMRGPMLQALLEDRFKLKVHRETREVPVYELTVAKSGVKFKASQEGGCINVDFDHPPPPPSPDTRLCGMVRIGKDGLDTYGATLEEFIQNLSMRLDRPVIDKTGLTGRFDIHLDVTAADLGMRRPVDDSPAPDPPPDPVAAILAALRPVGLRLEAARGPREFLVIDHVERPTEN